MTIKKQTFPPVTIEAMSNGLLRLEDETLDSCVIDLHPAQVQVLASMVGFTMPDKSKAALESIHRRASALHKQVEELEHMLRHSLCDSSMLETELSSAEFIGFNLQELVRDIDAVKAPDLVPAPQATTNPGGQLTLPV